jgi:hypothetical protein
MGSLFDKFTMALASGNSRRRALKSLVISAATAAVAPALMADSARAAEIDDENNPCVKACRRLYSGRRLLRCLRQSARCPWGVCDLYGDGCYDCYCSEPETTI